MALLPAQDNAYNCMLKASKSTLSQLLERLKRKRDDQGDASLCILNPILHTWFRDSFFTRDGSSTTLVFPLLFNIGMVI
jgi:hypothetical protein